MFITKKRYGRDMDEAEGRGYEQGVSLGYRLGFDAGHGSERLDIMANGYREKYIEGINGVIDEWGDWPDETPWFDSGQFKTTPIPDCWIKGMEDKDERG